jgi:hypothetical protein
MVDVTWTEQALADLEAVCRSMAHDALRYTEVFVMLQMQTLEKMPSAETRDLLGYASSPLSRRAARWTQFSFYRLLGYAGALNLPSSPKSNPLP